MRNRSGNTQLAVTLVSSILAITLWACTDPSTSAPLTSATGPQAPDGSSGPSDAGQPEPTDGGQPGGSDGGQPNPSDGGIAGNPHIQNVFVIMMENHDWSEVKGNTSAPYLNRTLLPQ